MTKHINRAAARAGISVAGRTAITLILGVIGGLLFFALDMPLAWMIGAMVITTIVSVSGARLHIPDTLRAVMIMVLGVLLGSAFTPEILQAAALWPITLLGLGAYLALVTGITFVYYCKVLGFDRATAYFCSVPGGLSEMVITGAAMGADDRTVALVQGCRVLLVVLIIPFWFRFTEDMGAGGSIAGPSLVETGFLDLTALTLCAVVGVLLARLLRLPAYRLVGPMAVSAAIHIAGITRSAPPFELVALAQIVVGCAIGARFAGISVERMLRTMVASLGSTALMLLCTLAFALALAQLSGLGLAPLVLAYAPGGLAEMTLIALSLGIETAFVATHHVVRIIAIVIGAPFVFRLLSGPRGRRAENALSRPPKYVLEE